MDLKQTIKQIFLHEMVEPSNEKLSIIVRVQTRFFEEYAEEAEKYDTIELQRRIYYIIQDLLKQYGDKSIEQLNKEIKEQKTLPTTPERRTTEQKANAFKKYKARNNIINALLTDSGAVNVQYESLSQGQTLTPEALYKGYFQLLRDKTLGKDPELMQLVQRHRKEVQHRFSCRVSIYAKEGLVAEHIVRSILIEHASTVKDYWQHTHIDPSVWFERLQQLQSILHNQFRCNEVVSVMPPDKHYLVTDTNITFTFT